MYESKTKTWIEIGCGWCEKVKKGRSACLFLRQLPLLYSPMTIINEVMASIFGVVREMDAYKREERD